MSDAVKNSAAKKYRFLNQDGTSNLIKPKNHTLFQDMYHSVLGLSWPQFFLILSGLYFSVNFLFALIYFFLGPAGLTGIKSTTPYSFSFLAECFFFSIQTFSTIGYGAVSPSGLLDNVVVSFQHCWDY